MGGPCRPVRGRSAASRADRTQQGSTARVVRQPSGIWWYTVVESPDVLRWAQKNAGTEGHAGWAFPCRSRGRVGCPVRSWAAGRCSLCGALAPAPGAEAVGGVHRRAARSARRWDQAPPALPAKASAGCVGRAAVRAGDSARGGRPLWRAGRLTVGRVAVPAPVVAAAITPVMAHPHAEQFFEEPHAWKPPIVAPVVVPAGSSTITPVAFLRAHARAAARCRPPAGSPPHRR